MIRHLERHPHDARAVTRVEWNSLPLSVALSDRSLDMNHVALVMSLNKRLDRKVIEGVTRFVRESGQWSVFVEDDTQAKIPDLRHGQFDGVIADLDDPRIPKRLVGLEIPAVGVGAIREDCPREFDISTVSTNNQRIAVLAAGTIKPEEGFRIAYENGADFICVGMFDCRVVNNVNAAITTLANLNGRKRSWLG